jgi:AraC family transcriptional regulator
VQENVAVVSEKVVAGGLKLREKIYAAGTRMGRHRHDCWRFCLALSGSFTDSWGSGYRTRSPLQLSLHPADEVHTSFFHTFVRCFHIEFGAEWGTRLMGPDGIRDEPREFLTGYVPILAKKMHREFRAADECSDLVLEGAALELIGFSRRQRAFRSSPGWIFQVRDALHDNFKRNRLSTIALAQTVGVHPVHLAHQFRKHFGASIGEYIRNLRIQFVCQRLRTDASLAEIAYDAGFADQSHMSRTFKRHTGCTPSQFRGLA